MKMEKTMSKMGKTIGKMEKSIGKTVKGIFKGDEHSRLEKFFIDQLKDIYWAEKNLLKSLPKMSKAATSPELKKAFDKHATETQAQVERLEKVFAALGETAKAKKCEAMDGLLSEANEIIGDTKSGSMVRDTALIFAAQKVEHYEIATYGSLKAVAGILRLKGTVVSLLDRTLKEEKGADDKLTKIAESFVNEEAAEE